MLYRGVVAGNLAKDRGGYEYEYDYENRIVKVTKDNSDIAEFAYDALGRRIRKIDSNSSETTLYYYNDSRQVLCEYSGGGSFERMFMYGNYIDEPIMTYSGGIYFYVQDHLYSTAALVDASGTPQERYEYDAYGQVHILDANFADDADGRSDCNNPYMFTGRRLDFFDGGNLTLQINRHRYYDYYTGRWLTQDPVGVLSCADATRVTPLMQYKGSLNLYEYVISNPAVLLDPMGTCPKRVGEPWMERDPQRRYEYTGWRPVYIGGRIITWRPIRETALISWQYAVTEWLTISIACGSESAPLIPAAAHWTSWYWPNEHSFDSLDIDNNNYICRIWVKCKTKCCKGDKVWEESWEPRRAHPTLLAWGSSRRNFVYGIMRTTGSTDYLGMNVTCRYPCTWSFWTDILCTESDAERECEHSRFRRFR